MCVDYLMYISPPCISAYDPSEFDHLVVSPEVKDLFKHITRFQPQSIELDNKLKPFIPEYIPAIGDIDAYLKVRMYQFKLSMLNVNGLEDYFMLPFLMFIIGQQA